MCIKPIKDAQFTHHWRSLI